MRAGPDDLAHMRHSDDVAAERDQERRDRLAEQLERDHIEGMADDRVEAERREFRYDFEGWTADDRLIVHIAGMGTLRLPRNDAVLFAHAILSEVEATAGWDDEQLTCDTCGRVGNRDDGIEPGGPCQEPCGGTVRRV